MTTRKTHSTQFKAKVALEAIREQKTINKLTSEYGVHATQINTWKKQVITAIPELFSGKRKQTEQNQQNLVDELYRRIGQLTVERDWLKKNSGLSPGC